MTDDQINHDTAAAAAFALYSFGVLNEIDFKYPEYKVAITNHRTKRHQPTPKHLIGPATPRTGPKIGRNENCGCGSGKKAKKCCGK